MNKKGGDGKREKDLWREWKREELLEEVKEWDSIDEILWVVIIYCCLVFF